ncbi:peptidylprolyl isomerase [Atopomonas sediminilitoris]|uniref:peptidylprolyl isomerase n=1 Tax=Atopomonas sediminilitoris TaxID=2919919 RepID=UPI001F4E1F79|nr:peptidylprolyl isomerase [Atopomonas sediminilitoris]MCJ8169151.1 peptidylprolyl isomerase [Atopomonas sediminilitoris]
MGCGCGGNGNGGGCGGGGRTEQPAVMPDTPFEDAAKPAEAAPAAPEAPAETEEPAAKASLELIATSVRADFPKIKVNGQAIKADAIAQELQYHPAATREDAVFEACQALVIRSLLQQRIAELGLDQAANGTALDEEALIQTLLAQEVTLPTADDAACERYFEQNRDKFASAPLVAARHILLACADDDTQARIELREQAQALIAQLQAEPDAFARLALAHSGCPSKNQGGELGQLSKGQAVPEFERQLFRLGLGLAAQPVESRYGFHVVWVDQHLEGRQLPFEAVKEKIRDELDQNVWQTAVNQYLRKLVGEAAIEGIYLQAS